MTMGRWAERQNKKGPSLGVRQHMAALEATRQIDELMQRRQVKRTTLAARLNKTRQWVSKLLQGERNLTLFTLVEVADALNADVLIRIEPRQDVASAMSSEAAEGMEVVRIQGVTLCAPSPAEASSAEACCSSLWGGTGAVGPEWQAAA